MATNAPEQPEELLYPRGTPFTEVIIAERELRDEAEAELNTRITVIEERLFIAEMNPEWDTVTYPELMEAFHKFKEEELKMLTFETLKNSK